MELRFGSNLSVTPGVRSSSSLDSGTHVYAYQHLAAQSKRAESRKCCSLQQHGNFLGMAKLSTDVLSTDTLDTESVALQWVGKDPSDRAAVGRGASNSD
eukprot:1943140-Amphidinium_carterae.2